MLKALIAIHLIIVMVYKSNYSSNNKWELIIGRKPLDAMRQTLMKCRKFKNKNNNNNSNSYRNNRSHLIKKLLLAKATATRKALIIMTSISGKYVWPSEVKACLESII